jgi:hypothetical protein
MLNTSAISRSFSSVLFKALIVLVYIIGKTTRKAMNMERFLEPIHMSASITKDATGTDFITDIIGDRSSLTTENLKASIPIAIPRRKAPRKPAPIFPIEEAMEIQKSALTNCPARDSITSTGPTKNILSFDTMLSICHSPIQKAIIISFLLVIVPSFHLNYLWNIVKILFWQLSSY